MFFDQASIDFESKMKMWNFVFRCIIFPLSFAIGMQFALILFVLLGI